MKTTIMTRIITSILLLFTLSVSAQSECTISAKNYVDFYIVPNGNNQITGTKMNTALNKVISAINCNDSVSKLVRKVDTIYKNSTQDSIVFSINNKRYAIKDSSGGSGGSTDSIYVVRTFADANNEMIAHTLNSGVMYQLTDFTTIYDQPDFDINGDAKVSVTTKTSAIEHLVFTANSDSTFDNYVSSIEYPLDKLKFDWSFTQTEYMNAPAKGRISERIDENNNRCDYDFRTVLYKRYESSTGSGIYSSWKDNGEGSQEFLTFNSIALSNYIGDFVQLSQLTGQPFILSNIVYQGLSAGNKMGVNCRQHTYIGTATDWIMYNTISDITALGETVYNYIGGNSTGFLFVGDAYNNYFGEDGENVTFLGTSTNNSIWDVMKNITVGDNFSYNIQYGTWSNSIVGNSFTDGIIYGLTDSITAGNNCFKVDIKSGENITIGNDASGLTLGGTKNITLGNGAKNIICSGGINGATWTNGILVGVHPELYQPYKKDILLGSDGNVYSRYFNGTIDVNTIID